MEVKQNDMETRGRRPIYKTEEERRLVHKKAKAIWYFKNKEKVKKQAKKWAKDNPEKFKAIHIKSQKKSDSRPGVVERRNTRQKLKNAEKRWEWLIANTDKLEPPETPDQKKQRLNEVSKQAYHKNKNDPEWKAHKKTQQLLDYEKHKDRYKARAKNRYEKNKQDCIEYSKQYAKDHREYIKEQNKKWREKNPGYHKQWYQKKKQEKLNKSKINTVESLHPRYI